MTSLTAQQVVDRCGAGDQSFCAAIVRNASGVITQVGTTQFNAQVLKTSGIDFEGQYRFDVGPGNVQLRSVATYTDKLITSNPGGSTVDTAGQLGTPKWRVSTTVMYTQGPLNLRALVNYVGKGKYDNTYGPLDINTLNFDAVTYLDLSAQYDLNDKTQIYAKIENVFDKDPPLAAGSTITIANAAAAGGYDNLGRVYGVGVRYRW